MAEAGTEWVWIDGALRGLEEAVAAAGDLGLLQGLGVFETLWAGAGRGPWEAERHGRRLAASCARMGLAMPDLAEVLAATTAVRSLNGLSETASRIRWTLWLRQHGAGQRLLVTATAAAGLAAAAKVGLVRDFARHSADPLAGIKTTSYGGLAMLAQRGRQQGLDEVLYGNERGELVEGAASNVFVKLDGVWRTPSLASGCLPGVTRAVLLELARAEGMEIREEAIALADLDRVEAAWLSNSSWALRPLASWDGREMDAGDAAMGRLRDCLARVRGEC